MNFPLFRPKVCQVSYISNLSSAERFSLASDAKFLAFAKENRSNGQQTTNKGEAAGNIEGGRTLSGSSSNFCALPESVGFEIV